MEIVFFLSGGCERRGERGEVCGEKRTKQEAVLTNVNRVQGQFGPWVVDQHDALEVLIYRLSLVGAALSVAAGVGLGLGSLGSDSMPPSWALDACAVGFFASFGVSVTTIHIYMKPMHNFLKVGTLQPEFTPSPRGGLGPSLCGYPLPVTRGQESEH